MYSMVTLVKKYCVVYLKLAKRVNLKSSYHKERKPITMCNDRS